MKRRIVCAFLFSLVAGSASAKDLGVWGELYPIHEQSMLDMIKNRLTEMQNNGQLAKMQEETKKRVIANTLRPKPTPNIKTSLQRSTFTFDPSITVNNDIADHKGRVFAHKGQKVNPADFMPFPYNLLFIDGDDAKQVSWAKRFDSGGNRKVIILVNGNIHEAGKSTGVAVYFDQNGELTKRFQVSEVPAQVSIAKNPKLLRVDYYDAREVGK